MSFSHDHPQLGTLFRPVAASSDVTAPVTVGDLIVYMLADDGELYSKEHDGTVTQLTGNAIPPQPSELYVETNTTGVSDTTDPGSLFSGTGVGSHVIPPYWFIVGRGIEVFMTGNIQTIAADSGNLLIQVGFSDVVLNDKTFNEDDANIAFSLYFRMICTEEGVSGRIATLMRMVIDDQISETFRAINVDTTVEHTVDAVVTWSVADAGNLILIQLPATITRISAA